MKTRIKKHEGCELLPYVDATGNLTIGYGRNLSGKGISQAEADMLFDNDYAQAVTDAKAVFAAFDTLCPVRQSVLVEMAFNIGRGRLASFKKMLAALNARDFRTAAKEMLDSRWARQVGKRADRLAQIMAEASSSAADERTSAESGHDHGLE